MIKYSISFLTIVFIVLFSTGCAKSAKPTVDFHEKKIPSWFLNPPQSTQEVLYSTGEGEDQKEAVVHALDAMVQTLSVSLESQFQSNSSTHNVNGFESYSKETHNNVMTHVKEIRITNYKVIKYEKLAFNKYVVLIQATKKAIFQSLKDEVNKKISLINAQKKSFAKTSVLERLQFYKRSIKESKDLIYKSIILKALMPNFKDNYIVEFVSNLKNNYTILKEKISFSLKGDRNSKNLLPVLKDAITSHGFKVNKVSNKYHLKMFVKSRVIYSRTYGFYIARSSITIDVKDFKNQTISTKQLNLIGQSTFSKNGAKEDLAFKLKTYIQTNKVQSIIKYLD